VKKHVRRDAADGKPATTDLASETVQRLFSGRLHDPFALLGRHPLRDGRVVVRIFRPACAAVWLPEAGPAGMALERLGATDLFEWVGAAEALPPRYRVRFRTDAGIEYEQVDPYCFGTVLDEAELAAFNRGEHHHAHWVLGSHLIDVDGVHGVRFAVWAPEAERVSVVGTFNDWDGRRNPMRVRGSTGVWELFVPGLAAGDLYKYELRNRWDDRLLLKSDPYARLAENRPSTASEVASPSTFAWTDEAWLGQRATRDWLHAPMSVYELHLGSWRRHPDGRVYTYREMAEPLAEHVASLGFTHVEFLPITEYPLDESWGYQPTGYFAPTRRYGEPDDLRFLIDTLHRRGIGVLLDWVPGHFPKDAHGLARFDGSAVYEYADTRKGEHAEWGTLVFNYDRNEVRSFLYSSALYWLKDFHFDGLRVDAVASMLYLDYSRKHGEWSPNIHGGNENLEAIAFMRRLNELTHGECPGSVTIAEESTAWPAVSRPTSVGGLGFSMKWNMGWMHDSLSYLAFDPVHRRFHHNLITFGPIYAFSENFVLPLSHDEVVHGKRSLLGRMPGDEWQRFANLRLLYLWQWTFPGKKLLFMGGEMAQPGEWDHRSELPWALLQYQNHAGIRRLIAELNQLYRNRPELHVRDFEGSGFQWLQWNDADQSVLSFLRKDVASELVIVINFTPVPRHGFRIGAPRAGPYREIFNSDSRFYGGTDVGNPLPLATEAVPCMGQPQSVVITLPPLGGVVLAFTGRPT
jgi:1,4-alpha-glucan branching enzyme